jgi:Hemagglutinin repeat
MVVSRVVAAGAALAAFTIVSVAPAAYADNGNNRRDNGNTSLKIDPSERSYRGGDVIKLAARCDSKRADLAVSAALTDIREWVRTGRGDFNIEATAKVRGDVRSGNFDVSFRCGDQKIGITINVDNGNGNGNGGTSTTNTTTTTVDTSTTMVMPSGAPQTGGAGPDDTGSGLLMAGELGGVVLVTGAGVAFAVNRRRGLASQHG